MTDLTFTGIKVVSGDIESQSGDIIAGDDIVAAGDITATTGNITATAGNIVATAGDVTAGDDIVATDDITAGGDITATTGNIAATAGSVTAGTNISSGRHILATGSAPTAAAGAQAGSSPPAPVVTAGSNDVRDNITFGTGGTSAAGAHVVVTFATAFGSAPVVMVIAKNTATEALGLYVSSVSTTAFTLSTTGDSADSQANTVYSFDYIVIG